MVKDSPKAMKGEVCRLKTKKVDALDADALLVPVDAAIMHVELKICT